LNRKKRKHLIVQLAVVSIQEIFVGLDCIHICSVDSPQCKTYETTHRIDAFYDNEVFTFSFRWGSKQ